MCLVAVTLLAQDFGYPVGGEPWYFVRIKMMPEDDLSEGGWVVSQLEVNGKKKRDFLLFEKGREMFDKRLSGKSPFHLKIRHAWRAEKEYEVRVELTHEITGKTLTYSKSLTAPALKGYWDQNWHNYLSLLIAEEHGKARQNYPIHTTVGILSEYFHSPEEIRVVKAENKGRDVTYTQIPFQIYDVETWKDEALISQEEKDEETGAPITRYHPTTTFSLAFLVDLKPREKATYLVFYNHPSAGKQAYESDLRVTGEGLGKVIENSFYRIELDQTSGMIFKVWEKETGILLEHKLETNGAIHWNPGAYSPPHAWTHCSDWKEPAHSEVTGPVFYALKRSAPLPHLKDIFVSINYYFYRDSPVILIESAMQVNADLHVKALRNGEMVFNKAVFDRGAYKTVKGKTEVIDFGHTRMHPEHVVTLRPDTPWVAFFNQEKGVAFASLFLDFVAANINSGGASQQQPYIYIQHGPWYYVSKAYVYSFGSNNQTRMLPVKKGSFYYEKTAWLPLAFKKKKGYARIIDKYYSMYKYPLHVEEIIETYPESPEGWLVPILTEPFDEGVERAVGGKKKK